MYSEQKTIDPNGPFAICRYCGYAHPFKQLPLFIVTGASGSGKSAACLQLVPLLPECVVLETDLFWRPEFDKPDDQLPRFSQPVFARRQKYRPVRASGGAVRDGDPRPVRNLPGAHLFCGTHYLALVCDDTAIQQRLEDRPRWRDSSNPDHIAEHIEFNRWIKANASQTRAAHDAARYDAAPRSRRPPGRSPGGCGGI